MTKTTAKKEDSALGERIDVVARELEALDDHELLRELLRRPHTTAG